MAKIPTKSVVKATVKHDIINHSGETILEKGSNVNIYAIEYNSAYWSKLCPDIYIEEKCSGIYIKEAYGMFTLDTFNEDLTNIINKRIKL